MSKLLNIYYSPVPEINRFDWEQIVQSLITYGEEVWMKSGSNISAKIVDDERKHVSSCLNELIEERIIKTWSFETDKSKSTNNRVISKEEHIELYNNINSSISYQSGVNNNLLQGKNIDKVTRFIEMRQELWNIGLASLCGANSIVYGKSNSDFVKSNRFYRYDELSKSFTETLFKKFNVPSLSGLSAADILELRLEAVKYRKKIDVFIEKLATNNSEFLDEAIISKCNEIYDEYLNQVYNLVIEKTRSNVVNNTIKDVTINTVGIFMPIAGFLSIADNLFDYFENKENIGFIFYMIMLLKKTSNI